MTTDKAREILGIKEDASSSDIEQACCDLISIWYPSRHNDNERLRIK